MSKTRKTFDYQDKIMIPIAIIFSAFMFYGSSIATDVYYQVGSFLTGATVLYIMIITYIHIYKFNHGSYKYTWYLP